MVSLKVPADYDAADMAEWEERWRKLLPGGKRITGGRRL